MAALTGLTGAKPIRYRIGETGDLVLAAVVRAFELQQTRLVIEQCGHSRPGATYNFVVAR